MLEEVAFNLLYFIDRNLDPNVDFYSGLIYEAMGFPMDMFTVLFAIGRTPGWLANWQELAQTLEGTTITIKANAGAEGRLFGSVTSANIASELSNEIGRGVDRRGVLLPQSIRELGSFNVPVRLFPGVELDVTVNVEATED